MLAAVWDTEGMAVRILVGDVRQRLAELPDESVHCAVTSPPYFGLRDYGVVGQIGLEPTPDAYVAALVEVFREVRRILRDDGTLWINLGDSYSGSGKGGNPGDLPFVKQASNAGSLSVRGVKRDGIKPKDLLMMPARVALALQADGWWLRSDIIWAKPNPMPESVTDRPTSAHEHVFLLARSERYYFDQEAVKEPGVTGDLRRPYAPGQVDERVAGHDRGGGTLRKQDALGKNTYTGFNARWKADHTPRNDGERWNENDGRGFVTGETRNIRNVWTIATEPFPEAHFATFPPSLIEPCIKAGCPEGGTVLDPFGGAGTTGLVADRLGRDCILIELNPAYAAMAERRIAKDAGMFADVSHVGVSP